MGKCKFAGTPISHGIKILGGGGGGWKVRENEMLNYMDRQMKLKDQGSRAFDIGNNIDNFI